MKGTANLIEKPSFLPPVVISRSEGDQDVIGLEFPHNVVQGSHRRVVSNLGSDLSLGRDVFDVAEHCRETLVGLVPSSIVSEASH